MLYCGALCWQNKNQVDMISDNGICMLFDRHAKIGRNNFFWTYGDVAYIQFQTWDVPLMNCSSVSHS